MSDDSTGERPSGPVPGGFRATTPHVTDELLEAAGQGRPLAPQVQAHLDGCAECRNTWSMLTQLQHALLAEAATPEVAPPPALRAELLGRARAVRTGHISGGADEPEAARPASPVRRPALFSRLALLPRLALGGAAVAAALIAWSLLFSPPGLAYALPDPAVVVNTGGSSLLLVASNGNLPASAGNGPHLARLTLISGERVSATLDVTAPNPAWFTEGVRVDDRVYLADAGNDRVLEIQVGKAGTPPGRQSAATRPLTLLHSFPVSGGVAGLSTGNGRVYFKSVRGQVGMLPVGTLAGRSVALAQEDQMSKEDVMDAVLLQEGTLYVTHHLRGELCLLDPRTLAVRRRVHLGGAPVALAALRGGLLVLDVKGRLLRLNSGGDIQQRWKLPGQPDKLVLNGERAVVTDRAGGVTELDLNSGAQTRVTLHHPMDVTVLGGGMVAVAQGQMGVTLLGADLKAVPGGEIR
ncbi:hypothetical protein [Deinococcus altitudinis]|uniref:hypothetical protein n=1 Tax=Deinococcus altitudinis TaxID=468914 RepID=UPI00389178E4